MKENPLVSVLINCYNGEKYLEETIQSVFAQTYENWEIVFWDNCSTDRTAEIAKSFGPKVKYHRGVKNVPLYHARNLAMPHCHGELLGIVDADDVWLPQKLEKQIPLFKNSNVGLVFSDTYFFNEDGIIKQFYDGRKYYTGKVFDKLLGEYFLSLETVLIRMEALKKLDYYFDPRFTMIGDADLFRRLAYDWEFEMVPDVLAKWRVHEESLSWKEPENFSIETKMMLDKYNELYPDFNQKYETEILQLRKEISLAESKARLSEGKKIEARTVLKPFLNEKKHKMLFCLSFLPTALFNILYQRYTKFIQT